LDQGGDQSDPGYLLRSGACQAIAAYLGDDLQTLEDAASPGRPLWDGKEENIHVRRATDEEAEQWKQSLLAFDLFLRQREAARAPSPQSYDLIAQIRHSLTTAMTPWWQPFIRFRATSPQTQKTACNF
jgi:hypothetical protein